MSRNVDGVEEAPSLLSAKIWPVKKRIPNAMAPARSTVRSKRKGLQRHISL
jgi:hypothetical protein